MRSYITERTLLCARHIEETCDTIRKTAKIFGISKSTLHNDLSKRLKFLNFDLYRKVQKILKTNFLDKHIRGGMATKNKYKKIKKI